jgi:hypothetical protein
MIRRRMSGRACSIDERKISAESARISVGLDEFAMAKLVSEEFERLSKSVEQNDQIWRRDLPGRIIFNKFAAFAKINTSEAIVSESGRYGPFDDIHDDFGAFRGAIRAAVA